MYAGTHNITLKLDDAITNPLYINFTIIIIENKPLLTLQTLPNIAGIADNFFTFHFNKTLLFSDPENVTFFMYLRQANNGNALPYFVFKNFSNGTIGGFGSSDDIGTYPMECVGVDDALQETVISFNFYIKRIILDF